MMYAVGVVGFVMRRFDVPVGPFVLGVVLMPLADAQFRRAMQISQGDPSVFVTRPIPLAILLVATAALMLPRLPALLARLRGKRPSA
jgi:putative tricarboxylic transport membrane protein